MRTSEFLYELPDELIAQTPVDPRDLARLLRGADLSDWNVRDLPELLESGDLVVLNETRVRAARLHGRRAETGGAVELLLLGRVGKRWEALVKPARRLRAGTVIEFSRLTARLETDPHDGKVEVSLAGSGGAVEDVISEEGEMPLPPYIREPLGDPDRYQTIYARRVGSAAAPTAGLHFTDGTFTALADRGIETATVELQVGLDTFRPITVDDIADHEIHSEWISVPASTVESVETNSCAWGSSGGDRHDDGSGARIRLGSGRFETIRRPHPALHHPRLPFPGRGLADDQLPYSWIVVARNDRRLRRRSLAGGLRSGSGT